MNKLLKLIFGDPNEKMLKELRAEAEQVNILEAEMEKLSEDDLRQRTDELKERIKVEGSDAVKYEAFAIVREMAKRTLNQRHYDVQLMGGLVLYKGMIAEMRTGEGKTLTSTSPIYLASLEGKGVHVVTVNDYLAKRDAVWMGQIFDKLGLTVGVIQQEGGFIYDASFTAEEEIDENRDETGSFKVQMDYLRPVSRKEAYEADITYGTNNQFGFDYLRDNMVMDADKMVQRGLHFAIIDEIDSILIDEARTPLIISAPAEESADLYSKFAQIATTLIENEDYNVDEKMRVATFTDEGLKKIERALKIDNLYAEGGVKYIHHAEQALRAEAIFKKDKDYVVQDGQVKIVDEFTGRIMEGRRYSEGLHQALEAKEGVAIQRESQTLATITFQNYFRMYEKLAGMTGTAETEAEEFAKIYELEVVVIPTNKEIARIDAPDLIFKSEKGKFMSLVEEVKARQEKGQPVLIGTASIEKNELVSEALRRAGVKHEVLNAKNHEGEGEIIAQAGRRGAVTVATNMAGRGVDIKLGGNPCTQEEYEEICELGGLCVLGTERHESRRIDNQLRGRAGRQGDPGYTQFFVSMEDDLMRIFGGERMKSMMETLGVKEDQPIESKMISNTLEKAQTRVEGHNFDSRKRVLDYDEVLNKHRTSIYNRRSELLTQPELDMTEVLAGMMEDEIERVVLFHTGEGMQMNAQLPERPEEYVDGDKDGKEILETLETVAPLTEDIRNKLTEELKFISSSKEVLARQRAFVLEVMMEHIRVLLKEAKDKIGVEEVNRVLKMLILRAIDNAWVGHLESMQQLRRGIGLRGYAQRDPLVEYNREAFHVFNGMNADIDRTVTYVAMKVLGQAGELREHSAPSILERSNIVFSGAQKTMERHTGANGGSSRASRRAAERLLQQGGRLPDSVRRAQLRKKRK